MSYLFACKGGIYECKLRIFCTFMERKNVVMLPIKVFDFLIDLQQNNTREWFRQNKLRYTDAKLEFDTYIDALILVVKSFDSSIGSPEGKDCTFRIYRDVRFSKNKAPYKNHFGAFIANGGRKSEQPGYYLYIEPGGKSFAGGGVYRPQPKILAALREEIAYNGGEFRKITQEADFKACFNEMYGEKLKTAPRGYPKDHPEIELLRYKDFTFVQNFSDKDLLSGDFTEKIHEIFKQLSGANAFLRSAFE